MIRNNMALTFTSRYIDMGFNTDIARSSSFSPTAMCDFSKFVVPYDDLVPYMEFGGNTLYDTGLRVYKDFVDEPQPANLAPPIILDPKPVHNPRPILNFMPWP
jgi:hypothetical protein